MEFNSVTRNPNIGSDIIVLDRGLKKSGWPCKLDEEHAV